MLVNNVISSRESQLQKLFADMAERAAEHDQGDRFVHDNYDGLKELRMFSAMVPAELGGQGQSYLSMCHFIRQMGQKCGSTALAFSMHQHLIAASCWKFRNRGQGDLLLRKVAKDELVLVSTGARDWLSSNGQLKRVKDGYLLTAKKSFASGCVRGNIAITSAPYEDPSRGWQVLHFPVSLDSEGVSRAEDWQVMGMRGTGSHTLRFEQVFIPDSSIALSRPRSEFHNVWNVVLTVAMPLIMASYVGIAEQAATKAIELGEKNRRNQAHLPYILGKLNNELIAAQVQWKAMTDLVDAFDFQPNNVLTSKMLSLKTNVAEACVTILQYAMEAAGGQGFFRKYELERLLRDVQASAFHPLPKWDQYLFSAEHLRAQIN